MSLSFKFVIFSYKSTFTNLLYSVVTLARNLINGIFWIFAIVLKGPFLCLRMIHRRILKFLIDIQSKVGKKRYAIHVQNIIKFYVFSLHWRFGTNKCKNKRRIKKLASRLATNNQKNLSFKISHNSKNQFRRLSTHATFHQNFVLLIYYEFYSQVKIFHTYKLV